MIEGFLKSYLHVVMVHYFCSLPYVRGAYISNGICISSEFKLIATPEKMSSHCVRSTCR